MTKFCQKLSTLHEAMLDLTIPFRNVTGKDKETIQKEEIQRLKQVSELGSDFIRYYNKNKIYFDKESCNLIEEIKKLFENSFSTFLFLNQMKLPPSKMTFETVRDISEKVRNEAPKLIEQLEDRLREVIDE